MGNGKKRGRKPMTQEEKKIAAIQRAERKNDIKEVISFDDNITSLTNKLIKAIKKNIHKLSAKEVEKVKIALKSTDELIDSTLTEKVEKEKAIKKAKLEKQMGEIQKELEAL